MGDKQAIQTLTIALAYAVTAQLGFVFSLTQHSPITLFWPPAGIALAAVILMGNLAMPGIFFGALLVNLLLLLDAPSWPVLGVGVVISIASTLAALFAGLLIRRFAASGPIWGSAADLLKGSAFMALACLLPALIGGGSLYGAGQLPSHTLGTTIGSWWLGDFCGMVIFTPIAFAAGRRLRKKFWQRLRPEVIATPTILNCIIASAALTSFISLWTLEGNTIEKSLQREASVSAKSLTRTLYRTGRDMESIRALVSASGAHLNEREFQRYTTSLYSPRKHYSSPIGVVWAPLVKSPKDWEMEMAATLDPSIRVYEWDESGRKIGARSREDYFPLQFIFPAGPAAYDRIGFDLGSEQSRRGAVELARDSGEASMAAPIFHMQTIIQEHPAMQICLPVYRENTLLTSKRERRAQFTGVTCAAYFIVDFIENTFENLPDNIVLHLSIGANELEKLHFTRHFSAGTDKVIVEATPAQASRAGQLHAEATVQFAAHQWQIVATPETSYINSIRSWLPWSALLLILALGIVGSSILIERAASRRRVATERRNTEEALHEARAASESKSYFMAAASHDIKQPLFALGILTDTLLMTNPPEHTKPIMKSLKKSIREMSQHFDTLMDVGRFQDGSFEVRNETFHLGELSRRIAQEIDPLCREKGLKWVINFDDVEITSDPNLLLRLLRNLLINAVRYTTEGEVRCTARKRGDLVEVKVSDTGSGLSPDQQELVYSEVVQLRPNEIHTSSLGLGMSIIKRISRALNLEITVETGEKQGTTFTFWIPAAHPDQFENRGL